MVALGARKATDLADRLKGVSSSQASAHPTIGVTKELAVKPRCSHTWPEDTEYIQKVPAKAEEDPRRDRVLSLSIQFKDVASPPHGGSGGDAGNAEREFPDLKLRKPLRPVTHLPSAAFHNSVIIQLQLFKDCALGECGQLSLHLWGGVREVSEEGPGSTS